MTNKTIIGILLTGAFCFYLKYNGYIDSAYMLSIFSIVVTTLAIVNTYILESFYNFDIDNIPLRAYTMLALSLFFCYNYPYAFLPISAIFIYYITFIQAEINAFRAGQDNAQYADTQRPKEGIRRDLSINIKARFEQLKEDVKLMKLQNATQIHLSSVKSILDGYEQGHEIEGIRNYLAASIAQYNDFGQMITADRYIDDIEVFNRLSEILTIMKYEV